MGRRPPSQTMAATTNTAKDPPTSRHFRRLSTGSAGGLAPTSITWMAVVACQRFTSSAKANGRAFVPVPWRWMGKPQVSQRCAERTDTPRYAAISFQDCSTLRGVKFGADSTRHCTPPSSPHPPRAACYHEIQSPKQAAHMPEKPYDHSQIELKWHERWRNADFYKAEANSAKPKFYVLEMLPYPSGTLHIGHIRNYSIGDALARYKWMRGFNVL